MEMPVEQDQWFNPSLLTNKWPEIAFKEDKLQAYSHHYFQQLNYKCC